MKQLTNKKGFTLIEIVIVLAIAALILVAIFLAVRGAQASRRDSQRRNAAGAIGSLVEESAGNHSGCYPATGCGATGPDFATSANSRVQTPDGGPYTITVVNGGALPGCPTYATLGGVPDIVRVFTTNTRQWRVAMSLQSQDVFCTDNL